MQNYGARCCHRRSAFFWPQFFTMASHISGKLIKMQNETKVKYIGNSQRKGYSSQLKYLGAPSGNH